MTENPDTIRDEIELSVVMPCLNEAETLGICISKAMNFMKEHKIHGEVVIGDNGSTDGSQEIARNLGARVVNVPARGYGNALIGGIAAARGKYIIMGDSDDSYDFTALMPFVEKLREGHDLVMGNRFKGGIKPGAMPPLHRYLGNPVLSFIGRLFFSSRIGDFHCGLRGFTKKAFERMELRTTGMEFASEMVVKATLHKLDIAEVPTTLSPDGRSGEPHLRSFRDGWRHLRFLLLYSPRWLFFYPGLLLMVVGVFVTLLLLPGPKAALDIHTILFAVAAIIIGFQSVAFAVLTKTYAIQEKLIPGNERLEHWLNKITLEFGIILGGALLLAGVGGAIYSFVIWQEGSFQALGITQTMRIVITSVAFLAIGVQIIIFSFFYSILRLKLKD
ncbi:MAG: glycosyltransferase family 2 protein [Candidatus Kapaibacterium sp.]